MMSEEAAYYVSGNILQISIAVMCGVPIIGIIFMFFRP